MDIAHSFDTTSRTAIVAKAAALLANSGQSTSMTLRAVQRLNNGLGIEGTLIPTWSSLTYIPRAEGAAPQVVPVSPTAINMRRVTTTMAAIDGSADGLLQVQQVDEAMARTARLPASGAAAFVLACATGAGALAVLFGASEPKVVGASAFTAAVGGVLRRLLGRAGAGPLVQVFAAAMLAGIAGATVASWGAGAALVTVCPAMILVPGPHVLNGALDMLDLRISLGLARLGYAAMLIGTIAAGLVIGLSVLGQKLPVSAPTATVSLPVDVFAATVAAVSYSVYFSMPYRLLGWSMAAAAIAHGVHWWVLTVRPGDLAAAALVACAVVGTLLVPLAHLLRIPFAGIGFAAVVSMVPGVYAFRALGGLAQLQHSASVSLAAQTMSDVAVTATVAAAMAAGIAVPMRLRDLILERRIDNPHNISGGTE